MARGHGQRRKRDWWTRERVLLGLERFFQDFGYCPTSTEDYISHQQFTGRNPATGQWSQRAWDQKHPSSYAVLKHFRTFREAWAAAGHTEVDRSYEEWTAMEDWFALESVGIIPRSEVSEVLKRSGPAIKRRLYDLGDIRSYNRWGITLTRAATLMKLSQAVVRKYLDYGLIPYLKGNKCFFLNPADLLKIEEFDWSAPGIDSELEQAVRRAVAQRICKMLKFGTAWREHEVYRFNKTKDRYHRRVKNPRKSIWHKNDPPPPNDLDIGDWVRTTGKVRSMRTEVGKRFGQIKEVYYSWQRVRRYDGSRRAAWVAMVEFPKIRTITGEKDRRIRYTIPLDFLERVDEPTPEPRPLSQHPDAIKGRARTASGEHSRRRDRIRARAAEFQAELT